MNIGLGCTVWASAERAGHLDGIGVYTRSLWRALESARQAGAVESAVKPFAFGNELPELECGTPTSLKVDFRVHALQNGIFDWPLAQSKSIEASVDVFHATDHLIPNIRNVPVVATVMDLIPLIHPEWIRQNLRSLKSWLFAKSIRSADHLITISEHSKQDLINHLGISPAKISVTPLGVDPVYFERVSADTLAEVLTRHGLHPGFFLFVGTLQPRKNLSRVLDAFQSLPDATRKAHPLVVVGRDGWGNETLIPRLLKMEQEGEVRWLKFLPQSDVMALLQSAAALVFASLYEGFGLPVIEAFAARCPVIASNTTSLPEVTGDAAWQVDPLDSVSIANGMRQVLESTDIRAAKIEQGLARAYGYSWDECARQTQLVYQMLLER